MMSACMDALLCPKIRIPKLGLKVYDNKCDGTVIIDECVLYLDILCKGTHIHLNNGQNERICGWEVLFKDMNDNQLVETDNYTGDMTKYAFRTCPNESVLQRNIVWRDFINVLWNKEDAENNKGDNGEYGVSNGVKTHMEWLLVSGFANKFFVHL